MRIMIGDTEYQLAWARKLDDPGKPKSKESKDEEIRVTFEDFLGNMIKFCLKHASEHYNLMNPSLKDIDNNAIYIKSITNHRISPIFAVSTAPDGIRTVLGVPIRLPSTHPS